MEEAAFLVAVQRIIRGVEVERDLLGRCLMRVEEEVDEQLLDRRSVVADLVVARRRQGRVLEPVERALAGERSAVLAPGLELACQRRQHRIVAQLIVIDQVFVPERDAEHPLRHHGRNRMLDPGLGTTVIEAGGEPLHQTDRPIGRAEQQRAGVRGGIAAIERRHHRPPLDHFKTEQVAATLRRHRGSPLRQLKSLWQKSYARFRAPMHLLPVRNPG